MPSSTLQLLVSFPSINPGKALKDSLFTKTTFSLLLHQTSKRPLSLFYNARFLTLERSRLAIRVEAKLRSSQVSKGSALPDGKRRKEIVLFDAARPLLEESAGCGIDGGGRDKRKSVGSDLLFLMKLPKRVLAVLSNLPLAIGEMFTIATLMALGMFT